MYSGKTDIELFRSKVEIAPLLEFDLDTLKDKLLANKDSVWLQSAKHHLNEAIERLKLHNIEIDYHRREINNNTLPATNCEFEKTVFKHLFKMAKGKVIDIEKNIKPENKTKFIAAAKKYMLQMPFAGHIEFSNDYKQVKKI